MFKITPGAAAQVKSAAEEAATEGMALRLAAMQHPDGSIEYKMGFDEVKEEDVRVDSQGVEIVFEVGYLPLLETAVMDFVELDSGEQQFVFHNPKDATYVPPEGGIPE